MWNAKFVIPVVYCLNFIMRGFPRSDTNVSILLLPLQCLADFGVMRTRVLLSRQYDVRDYKEKITWASRNLGLWKCNKVKRNSHLLIKGKLYDCHLILQQWPVKIPGFQALFLWMQECKRNALCINKVVSICCPICLGHSYRFEHTQLTVSGHAWRQPYTSFTNYGIWICIISRSHPVGFMIAVNKNMG